MVNLGLYGTVPTACAQAAPVPRSVPRQLVGTSASMPPHPRPLRRQSARARTKAWRALRCLPAPLTSPSAATRPLPRPPAPAAGSTRRRPRRWTRRGGIPPRAAAATARGMVRQEGTALVGTREMAVMVVLVMVVAMVRQLVARQQASCSWALPLWRWVRS